MKAWNQSFTHPLRLGQYSPLMQSLLRALKASVQPGSPSKVPILHEWEYLQWQAGYDSRKK